MDTGHGALVITLWERYGSNMDAVASALAERLGLALHAQAYSSESIEVAVEEREHQGPLARFVRDFAPASYAPSGAAAAASLEVESSYARMAVESAAEVEALAARGGVILGRNGQFVLRHRPNTLHVKLDGPVAARVALAARVAGITPERAAKRQRIEDDFRAGLSRKLYRFDPRANEYYDLVVNGALWPTEVTVGVIAAAAKAKLG
ncbi:cytidylate kinase family protein [Propioniciclava soli]|uniref:Cytidylate kinase family protein n=1 Tax=Propioniciclava soli TaxID=2775081 RepID=A0ABZ3CC10_9ACTN|nr:cytidylate kinase family protein [Propioniciclava soli]